MEFYPLHSDDREAIREMSCLATAIVREHFDPIIGTAQNDYMLEKFQSETAISHQLRQGYNYYFVDEHGKHCGFLAFYPRDEEMYLSKFYLEKSQRGQGKAREMLDYVVARAREAGLGCIVLNCNRNNPAILAYEKMGFKKIAEEKNDIGQGFAMDDYVFSYAI